MTPSFRRLEAPGTFLMMKIEEIEPHVKFLRNGSVSLKNVEAGVTTSVLAEEYQINNALQNVQLCFLYRLYKAYDTIYIFYNK